MNSLLLGFLATLEALAGKPAKVSRDPGDGRLEWIWEVDSSEIPDVMIFVDWDNDQLTFSWCACGIKDGDAPIDTRRNVCLGRIPSQLGKVLREFSRRQLAANPSN